MVSLAPTVGGTVKLESEDDAFFLLLSSFRFLVCFAALCGLSCCRRIKSFCKLVAKSTRWWWKKICNYRDRFHKRVSYRLSHKLLETAPRY